MTSDLHMYTHTHVLAHTSEWTDRHKLKSVNKASHKNNQRSELKAFYISSWSSLYFWQQIYLANYVLLMLKLILIGVSCEHTE